MPKSGKNAIVALEKVPMKTKRIWLSVKLRRDKPAVGRIKQMEIFVNLYRKNEDSTLPLTLSVEAMPKEQSRWKIANSSGEQVVGFEADKNTSSVANFKLEQISNKGPRQILLLIRYAGDIKPKTLKVVAINPFKIMETF